MTGKSNDNSAEDLATSDVDAANPERSLGYRTRVATIVVSVVVMLFCAIFWQSVLDFKSKIERKSSFDEFAYESYDESDESDEHDAVVARTDDWREQLAALYPREEFESDVPQSAPAAPAASGDRASRFNEFVLDVPISDASDSDSFASESSNDDSAPLPPAPSVARNVRDEILERESPFDGESSNENEELGNDDNALVAAAPFDVENAAHDDEPLPVAPRTTRSAYAPDDEPLAADSNGAPEDSALLADLPTVDPNDPLGLESDPSLEPSEEIPAAPGSSRMADASDAKSRVAFAGYSALAESAAASPSATDETPDDPTSTVADRTTSVGADEASFEGNLPVSDDADAEPAAIAAAPVVRPSKAELAAVADAVFAPSYFSRAVGLFGGQNAFSALYFARAAQIVSDTASWSPDSWSHVAPIAVSGAPTPKKTQNAGAPEIEGTTEVENESDSDAPVDDATAAAMHAKYPTLVGYIERRSIKSPEPLSTVEPNKPAVVATPASASGAPQ